MFSIRSSTNHSKIPTPMAATRAPQAPLLFRPAAPVCVLPSGPVVVPPLPAGPPGAVGVATTKLVRVWASPPERLVVTSTKLDVGLGAEALSLVGLVETGIEVSVLVVMAVLVVERLLEAVDDETVVVTVVTGVVVSEGVPEGVPDGVVDDVVSVGVTVAVTVVG